MGWLDLVLSNEWLPLPTPPPPPPLLPGHMEPHVLQTERKTNPARRREEGAGVEITKENWEGKGCKDVQRVEERGGRLGKK